jgi:multiple sugar transport system permease protein
MLGIEYAVPRLCRPLSASYRSSTLTDERLFTLSLGLRAYQSQHGGAEWHTLMAASMIVITPLMLLFFLTQRTFVQGVRLTGLKG